ncbi:MAG: LysR family transcriptional regulator [Lachnospiraceae bacterium]|nr:LysR family transcriptional regulator [Lachnospiraceae bacterium]
MNRTQLEYFVSVAELKNFTKAAQKHFVSQTAITQQIQNLEESLHTRLFDRRKRPVKLTEAGEVFLNEAKAILERMNGAVVKLANVSTSESGTIRLGYTNGYENSRLSRVLREYRRSHPNVFFICKSMDCGAMAQALLNEELDIIFTWDRDDIIKRSGLVWRTVEESTLDVVVYNTHPFVNRTRLTRKDLREEKLIYLAPSGELYEDGYYQKYKDAGYEPQVIHYSDDINSILMMVSAEEGITVMPTYITNKITRLDGVECIPLVGANENAAIVAVWKEDCRNPRVRDFLEGIRGN